VCLAILHAHSSLSVSDLLRDTLHERARRVGGFVAGWCMAHCNQLDSTSRFAAASQKWAVALITDRSVALVALRIALAADIAMCRMMCVFVITILIKKYAILALKQR
jgi:hypothetical protein